MNIVRRELLTALAGAAAWPIVARGQQPAIPVIGFLHSGLPEANAKFVMEFRNGLGETGFFDGRNVKSITAGRTLKIRSCQNWQPNW